MKKVLLWLDKYMEECVMLVLLAGMVFLMGLQIFMRYVMKASLPWPEELIRYMFIWFVFLGISYGVRYNIHLRVDLLEIGLPKLKPFLNFLQDVVFFAFCLYMIRPAYAAVRALVRNGQTSAAMDMPMYLVYVSLLIGFALTTFRFVQKYVRIIGGMRRGVSVADNGEGEGE